MIVENRDILFFQQAFFPQIKQIAFLILLLFLPCILIAQGLVFTDNLSFNNFYTVTVTDNGGSIHSLFDVAYWEGENSPWPNAKGGLDLSADGDNPHRMQYFFWVKRMGTTGAITYPMPFSRIRKIVFTDDENQSSRINGQDALLIIEEEENSVRVSIDGNSFSGHFAGNPSLSPFFSSAILTLTDGNEHEVHIKTDGFLGGIDDDFGVYSLLWLQYKGIESIVFNHDGHYQRCPQDGAFFYAGNLTHCPFDGTPLVPFLEP